LFHCMGGPDRTGMIALLLLLAAEVEPDETTEAAFLSAVNHLDPAGFAEAAQLSKSDIRELSTWRGSMQPPIQKD
jgi:hypothetical protein